MRFHIRRTAYPKIEISQLGIANHLYLRSRCVLICQSQRNLLSLLGGKPRRRVHRDLRDDCSTHPGNLPAIQMDADLAGKDRDTHVQLPEEDVLVIR